jgi:hypothetical protein
MKRRATATVKATTTADPYGMTTKKNKQQQQQRHRQQQIPTG